MATILFFKRVAEFLVKHIIKQHVNCLSNVAHLFLTSSIALRILNVQ